MLRKTLYLLELPGSLLSILYPQIIFQRNNVKSLSPEIRFPPKLHPIPHQLPQMAEIRNPHL